LDQQRRWISALVLGQELAAGKNQGEDHISGNEHRPKPGSALAPGGPCEPENGSHIEVLPAVDNWIRGPVAAPAYPGSCPVGASNDAWLGSFSGFTYFCDGGTVKRVAIT
jgi:hypothetical protein